MPTAKIIICSFFNIAPINTVMEGLRRGSFTAYDPFIKNKTVPLRSVRRTKTLHLVCFRRTVKGKRYIKLLRAHGKQPCRNARGYLLGLMAQIPEREMPAVLRDKDILAAGPNNAYFVSADIVERPCFLYVYRCNAYPEAIRKLRLKVVGLDFHGLTAFLTEDIPLTKKAP